MNLSSMEIDLIKINNFNLNIKINIVTYNVQCKLVNILKI